MVISKLNLFIGLLFVFIFILNSFQFSALTIEELLTLEKAQVNLNAPNYNFLKDASITKPNFIYISSNGKIIGIELKNNSTLKIAYPEINLNKNDSIPYEILVVRSNCSMITTASLPNDQVQNPIINKQPEMVILNEIKQFTKDSYIPHASIYYDQSKCIYNPNNYVIVGLPHSKGEFLSTFTISMLNSLDDPKIEIINYYTGILINSSLENIQSFKTCHNKITNNYFAIIKDSFSSQYIIIFNIPNKEIKETIELKGNNKINGTVLAISESNGIFIVAINDQNILKVYQLNLSTLEKKLLFSKPQIPNYFIKSENTGYLLFYSSVYSLVSIYDLQQNHCQDISISNEFNNLLNVKIDSSYSTHHGNLN